MSKGVAAEISLPFSLRPPRLPPALPPHTPPLPCPPCSALPPAKAAAPDSATAATTAAAAGATGAAVAAPLSAAQVASGRLWSAKVVLFSGVPEAALSAQDYKAFQVGGQGWGRVGQWVLGI